MPTQKTEKERFIHEQVGDAMLQLNQRIKEQPNWFEFAHDFPVFIRELIEETWDKANELFRKDLHNTGEPIDASYSFSDSEKKPISGEVKNPIFDAPTPAAMIAHS